MAMNSFLKDNEFLHRQKKKERANINDDIIAKNKKYLGAIIEKRKPHYIKSEEIGEFKRIAGKMTKDERKNIYADPPGSMGYIGTAHSFRINRHLRNQTVMPPEYDRIVKNLDKVLHKNKTHKPIKVNRFDDLSILDSIIQQNAQGLKKSNNTAEFFNLGEAKFENQGYMSTSYIPKYNVFTDRPVKTIVNIPKGANIYFTDNDDESEIVLPRNSKFDIISVKNKKHGYVIEMNLILE